MKGFYTSRLHHSLKPVPQGCRATAGLVIIEQNHTGQKHRHAMPFQRSSVASLLGCVRGYADGFRGCGHLASDC